MTKYAGYRYIGSSPYVLAIKGEVYRLKPGDCVELQMAKLKTRRIKKLLKVVYK